MMRVLKSTHDPQRVAMLLNALFDAHRHPSGREFTNREVARAIQAGATAGFIRRLRNGEHLQYASVHNGLLLLCVFFDVEPFYFHPAGVLTRIMTPQRDLPFSGNMLFTARTASIPAELSLIERLEQWWDRISGAERQHKRWQQEFGERQQEQAARRSVWMASLPSDLRAELHELPASEIDWLIDIAALTPECDRADAVRRWRTLPNVSRELSLSATLTERVDYLFRTQLRPDGSPYRAEDVAQAFDGSIDPDMLDQIRSGALSDPDPEVIFKLGRFFHARPTYFYPIIHIRYAVSPLAAQSRIAEEKLLRRLLPYCVRERGADTDTA
jgi:hypothetical protein